MQAEVVGDMSINRGLVFFSRPGESRPPGRRGDECRRVGRLHAPDRSGADLLSLQPSRRRRPAPAGARVARVAQGARSRERKAQCA
jgi:hypothetical protein